MERRYLLKKAGSASIVGLATAATAGQVAADASTVHGVDTEFDPNSREEIRNFFAELGELPERERVEVQEQLGTPQAQAVVDVLESIEFGIDFPAKDARSNELSLHSSWDEEDVSATEYAEHWALGYRLWEIEYEVEWEYDGSEIRNVTEVVRPDTFDGTWSHDGEVSGGTWMNEDDDEWNGRKQHKFSYVGGGTIPTLEYTPWIELEGDASGTGNVVDSGNGN